MPITSQPFTGRFHFSGNYAFLKRPHLPEVLLQFDSPFTGDFNDLAAQNTSNALQAVHQEGDAANLTGLIQNAQVSGHDTQVLFLFA